VPSAEQLPANEQYSGVQYVEQFYNKIEKSLDFDLHHFIQYLSVVTFFALTQAFDVTVSIA
jgi:hypothetical protein